MERAEDVSTLFPIVNSGDHSGGVTPDPIPNSAVKPSCADGTTRANVWESRSSPDLVAHKRPERSSPGTLSFCGFLKDLPLDRLKGIAYSRRALFGSFPYEWRLA